MTSIRFLRSLPRRPVDITQSAQGGERRLNLEDPLARLPRIDISYRVPSNLSPDDDSIEAISRVLAGGRSSRLHESIVRRQATGGECGRVRARQPRPTAVPHRGHTDARQVARGGRNRRDAEIELMKAKPVADWEPRQGDATAPGGSW